MREAASIIRSRWRPFIASSSALRLRDPAYRVPQLRDVQGNAVLAEVR